MENSVVYKLWISSRPPGERPPLIKVNQGEMLTLVVSTQSPGMIYIHGYDVQIGLKPGEDVSLSFLANLPGSFPVHVHDPDGSMRQVARLEVQPH